MPNDEIRHAFDHPEARSRATATRPLDRISLRDHVVAVEIGAFQLERGVEQRLRFDIVVEVAPLGDAGDDVDRILSYDRLTEAVAAELARERLNLLETLAERVATRILHEPQAERAFVRIQKLDRGPGDLGVEIVRAKSEAGQGTVPDAPRPRVVLLGHDSFDAWTLGDPDGPVVLCVDRPEATPVMARTDAAQRHIDLLALDQNAWALASHDARLIVVATRTELDWALRRGQPCVWAPSRMVLDAVRGPEGADGARLAAWLAGEIGATELRLVGVDLPPGLDVPVPVVA